MLVSVDFLSQDTFKATPIVSDMAVISIGDPASAPPPLPDSVPVLRTEFLDLAPDELELYGFPADCLVSIEQVSDVTAFIEGLTLADSRYRLVIHCRKGYSRSAAVALVAHALSGCEFPRRSDAYGANTYVLELAARILGKKILRPAEPTKPTYSPLPARLLI